MDKIMAVPENKDGLSAGVYFALFAAATGIFIAVGMKCPNIFESLSFYGRYDGLSGSITEHVFSAAVCAMPCLMQLLTLYLLSYSSLLHLAALVLAGWRGFTVGASYCAVIGVSHIVQLAFYISATAIICITSALLLKLKNSSADNHLRRLLVLSVSAGICVTGELILSYLV